MRPLLLLLLLVPVRAAAQREPFVRYGAREGLEDARALAPDGPGALYVATGTGVGRFDGERLSGLVPLPEGAVRLAAEGPRAWAVSGDGELWRIESGAAQRLRVPAALARVLRDPYRVRLHAGAGRLFVAAREAGLWALDERPGEAPRWARLDTHAVRSVARGPDGTLWATARDGFGVRRPGARAFAWHPRPARRFDAVVAVPGGAWLIADDGVWRAAPDGRTRRVLGPDLVAWWSSLPAATPGGGLLAALWTRPTGKIRVYELDGAGRLMRVRDESSGIGDLFVRDLHADAEGGLWVVHATGIRTVLPPGRASTRSTRPRASGNWPANLSRATTQRSGSWRGRAFTSPTRRDVSPASAQPCASSPVASSRTGRARGGGRASKRFGCAAARPQRRPRRSRRGCRGAPVSCGRSMTSGSNAPGGARAWARSRET